MLFFAMLRTPQKHVSANGFQSLPQINLPTLFVNSTKQSAFAHLWPVVKSFFGKHRSFLTQTIPNKMNYSSTVGSL